MVQYQFIHRLLLLTILSFLLSCSEVNEIKKLSGSWISKDSKMIVEFVDDYLIFKPFGNNKERITVIVEKVDDERFRLIGEGIDTSSELVVNWNDEVIKITPGLNLTEGMVFTKAPNIQADEILGNWHIYQKDDESNIETLDIITQRVFSYDYNHLKVDHESKTFFKSIDLDVSTILSDGFIFNDANSGEVFSYYITDFTENKLSMINENGEEWVQYRKEDPKHLTIPEGYIEEE